jgi:hypothetical protein
LASCTGQTSTAHIARCVPVPQKRRRSNGCGGLLCNGLSEPPLAWRFSAYKPEIIGGGGGYPPHKDFLQGPTCWRSSGPGARLRVQARSHKFALIKHRMNIWPMRNPWDRIYPGRGRLIHSIASSEVSPSRIKWNATPAGPTCSVFVERQRRVHNTAKSPTILRNES